MSKIKRFFAIALSICMLTTFSYAIDPSTQYIPLETNANILQLNTGEIYEARTIDSGVDAITLEENLNVSADAYDNMMRSFYNSQPDTEKYKTDEYTVAGITAEGFPEVYAGAYTNKNLDLVVMLTEDTTTNASAISAGQDTIITATNTDDIIFSTAQYSYRTLVSLMDDVYQYVKSGKNGTEGFNVVSYALDDYNNRVIVGLENVSVNTINRFNAVVTDSPAIDFVEVETQAVTDDTTLKPGLGTNMGSIAFHIYKYENNKYVEGFVTAAHCYDPGDPVKVNGTTVADAHSTAWQESGNMDAVFCVMRSGHSFSNTISYIGGTLRDGIDANLSQGHPVTMVGRSTQGSDGTVQTISYGYTIEGISFYDLAGCNYSRQGGDSGGIVVSTRTGANWIAGVHKGSGGGYSAFSKAINITFGLELTFDSGN